MHKAVKVALVANTSWSLYNFRLELIKALKDRGIEVILIAPVDNYTSKLVAEGYRFIPYSLENYSTNPISELKTLRRLYKIYKKEKPDFIFHYTIKPNFYGTLAAKLNKIPSVAITTGLGRLISIKNSAVKLYTNGMYRLVGMFAEQIWFLNQSDLDYFLNKKLIKRENTHLLKSEGVDIKQFRPLPEYEKKDGITRFLFAGRLIREKGIFEYVQAARNIRKKYPNSRFQVLGFIEPKNPGSVKIEELESWQSEGLIEFLGATEDVRPFIAASDCIVLPSYYGEGVPRILMEASAMGKAVIASNIAGCREVVKSGVTGYLSQPYSNISLTRAFEKILSFSDEDCAVMGQAGRVRMVQKFSQTKINEEYLTFLQNFFSSRGIKFDKKNSLGKFRRSASKQ